MEKRGNLYLLVIFVVFLFPLIQAAISIEFLSQSPGDINNSNLFSNPLRINYNITGDNIDISTIRIYYKANSSLSNIHFFLNGSAHEGYFPGQLLSNVSSNFSFRLLDNEAYPGTFNLGAVSTDNLNHNKNTTSNNYFVKTQYYNISGDYQWGVLEIMANSTLTAGPASVYYCNSSYIKGRISTNSNCALIATRAATGTFDHCHLNSSCHNTFQFNVNTTTRTISGIKITALSYFLFGTKNPNPTWSVYNIQNRIREGMTQVSTDTNSNTWVNQSYSVDQHIHQYPTVVVGNTSFYYYVCVNDTFGNSNCSSVRNDLLELGGLAPTSPQVHFPVQGTYSGNIDINYTEAESPNSYEVNQYNISLLNSDLTFNKTLINNNSVNLSFILNTSAETNGDYVISIRAYDSIGQTSIAYSEPFTIDNTESIYNLTIIKIYSNNPVNTSLAKLGDLITLNFNSSGPLLNPVVEFDSGGYLVNNINTITNLSNNYSATYLINSSDYDGEIVFSITADNLNLEYYTVTDASFVIVDKTPPIVTLSAPSNLSSSTITEYNFTFEVFDSLNLANCSLFLNNERINYLNVVSKSSINSMYNSSLFAAVHTWNINCTDILGNEGVSEIRTLTISEVEIVETSENNLGYIPQIHIIQNEISNQGDLFTMRIRDQLKFNLNKNNHTLTLNNFNSSWANVTIESTPLIVFLELGISKNIDLNNDFIEDITIRYDGIDNSRVIIFIKEILITPQQTSEIVKELNEEKENFSWGIIILIIVVIVILSIFYHTFFNKKEKNKRRK